MRYINLTILLVVLICSSCGQTGTKANSSTDDKTQIINLVKQVLKWHDKDNQLIGFGTISNPKDSLIIGMDLKLIDKGLEKLVNTDYFDKEFINNYKMIILKIDNRIKNKELVWHDGEEPPYANADPWCDCQDTPYDNAWAKIDIKFVNIDKDKAELSWTWGNSDWSKNFKYEIKVKKVNGVWRISYMQGFNIKNY